ncbi:anaerobic ribonucleoside-triphosphate reductase activating protein [Desulfonema magnum]|uniref:Anaerobic ribonucleoside-triphosphate reductase activating protein n=1 Tax=Desulfonema magnum TaxID=45655 RepID=A0A975BFS6_9BACT|nr:anaerobic ribonucleoside-triphosphate reductase activating protein [Desulfonema magnum]QTA84561.1 Anaerobic ribonucleoside-triphosphate reductase activating protein [Desulfonema magnum]
MIFGGLQKNSFIDYPGKISCVLFLSGCNFNCPYCHNPDLVKGCAECPHFLEENGVYDFLKNRRGLLDGVVISGGEPTLQDDLVLLCEKIKDMGYPVKVDTNGSRPKVIQGLIDRKLVDYIAMDIKTDPLRYSPLIKKHCNPSDIFSSIRIIMESGLPYEFKTTCIKPLVNDQIIENISHIIHGARLYALQEFRNTEVLHPEFFQGNKCSYDKDELIRFKAIADPWVEKCVVR